jgi:natural product precursor
LGYFINIKIQQMKKISLKALKEGLSRDEMRALKGGGCGNGVGGTCTPGSIVFNCAPGLYCVPYNWGWGPGGGICRTTPC